MKNAVLADNYRKELNQPPKLEVQKVAASELQRFAGTFQRQGKDGQADVALADDVLRVDFGNWVDELEPLGRSLFRVPGTKVTYVFHANTDGAVLSFEVNDGDDVYLYHRAYP